MVSSLLLEEKKVKKYLNSKQQRKLIIIFVEEMLKELLLTLFSAKIKETMNKVFTNYKNSLKLRDWDFKDFQFIATIDQTEYIHIKGTKKHPRGAMMYDTIPTILLQEAIQLLPKFSMEEYGITFWSDNSGNIIKHDDDKFYKYFEDLQDCVTILIDLIETEMKVHFDKNTILYKDPKDPGLRGDEFQ